LVFDLKFLHELDSDLAESSDIEVLEEDELFVAHDFSVLELDVHGFGLHLEVQNLEAAPLVVEAVQVLHDGVVLEQFGVRATGLVDPLLEGVGPLDQRVVHQVVVGCPVFLPAFCCRLRLRIVIS